MSLLDLLFPKKCVGCKTAGQYFCDSCQRNILQGDLICPKCFRPSIGGFIHPICKRKYSLDGLWSLGLYKPPLKQAVQKLKYRWIKDLAKELVDLTIKYWAVFQPALLDEIKKSRGEGWVITCVPLHWKRQNWRGFNQSALLAQLLAGKLGLDYVETLAKVKETKPQAKLPASNRRQNIKNAFSLNTDYLLHNTNVILVDDVWTTGSTMKECAYVLKRSCAKKVWGLTIAR